MALRVPAHGSFDPLQVSGIDWDDSDPDAIPALAHRSRRAAPQHKPRPVYGTGGAACGGWWRSWPLGPVTLWAILVAPCWDLTPLRASTVARKTGLLTPLTPLPHYRRYARVNGDIGKRCQRCQKSGPRLQLPATP